MEWYSQYDCEELIRLLLRAYCEREDVSPASRMVEPKGIEPSTS